MLEHGETQGSAPDRQKRVSSVINKRAMRICETAARRVETCHCSSGRCNTYILGDVLEHVWFQGRIDVDRARNPAQLSLPHL